ncbi:MAG TPA: CusA/CzcA family heavy metal efflux RND transporter [Blastocatellia bacterium]|nr:CusA/CzcA family heavy metal efflux RND transporter [Blastocatellia bacterium]
MGKFIDFILRERLLVVAASVILLVGGLFAFKQLNIEAYPDPSPPTIEVIAQNGGWSAEEMERQITVPLETELNGMPGLDHIRSISLFGLTDIKCYFQFETDYNFDRQEVLNRMQLVTLPAGVQPQLSPTSAVGEIYRYQLVGDPGVSLMDLKVAEDWILERQFKQIPGVIDVVSFGGPTKEFHVDLDPNKLIAFNVTVPQVMTALANSNSNVGANYLELGVQSFNVRGIGLFKDSEDISNVAVASKNGTPIYVKQLGEVTIGSRVPTGRVGKDDQQDIVQGIVLMRKGEKSLPTLDRVRQRVEQINNGILPTGMKIVPYYDRTDLINLTTHTVTHTLIEGMVLVAFILLAFLGDLRASLVVALSIPLSLLFTFILMVLRGDSANLISMGAIDFGIIVDASVVMVENIYRHLAEPYVYHENVRRVTQQAAMEVVKPIFFSSAIIVVAFIPLFTMSGVEGKVFGPMAVTYGFALTGALLLALTFSPVMASIFLKRASERETMLVRAIRKVYSPMLRTALNQPIVTTVIAVIAMIATLAAFPLIGGEFMPKLEEGNLWVRASMPNTISFTYASELADQMRAVFRKYPEVITVVSQLGRPDDGTDPTSYFNCEFFVPLKPREQWPRGLTKEELVEHMENDLKRFPGVDFNFSQNIQDNVEEAMSGVKGENSIKLFGDDLEKLEATANKIKDVMGTIDGVADLGVFGELGQPNLLIRVDRQQAARYGVLPGDVNGVVQAAIGGQAVTQVLDGEKRFDVVVRFLPEYRQNVEAISNITIGTPDGGRVPLKQVADISKQTGASFIYREDNSRYIPIKFSVRGRDLQSTIAEAEAKIKQQVVLPSGYHYEWAGEFQELQEAIARLEIVVPVSLLIIFFLLYGQFNSVSDALLILGAIPPGLIGGVIALLITGTNFSISAAVGFISLFGVSVLGGVILISRIRQLRKEGVPLREAVMRGSELQLRPVLMAALAAAIGLLPASLATGIGSETQRPLARVVVGGMISSAVLILLVLPAMYSLMHGIRERRKQLRPSLETDSSEPVPEPR